MDERIDLWEEYNEENLFGLRCSTLSDRSIMATQTNVDLQRLRVTHIQGNEHVIERSASSIRTNPVDAVMLCLLLEGNAFLYHRGGCETLTAGDAVVYDANRPFMYGFSTNMRQIIVEVPRDVIDQHPPAGDPYAPQVLHLGDSPSSTHAHMAARSALRSLKAGPETGAGTEESLLQMFHLLTGNRESAGTQAHLKVAQAFVEANLAEDLSVERVAAQVGISPRHLARLFTDSDTTPARYITERRLARAAEMLKDPSMGHLSIAQIGGRVGLRRPSHFSRIFRAHYGLTPGEQRSKIL